MPIILPFCFFISYAQENLEYVKKDSIGEMHFQNADYNQALTYSKEALNLLKSDNPNYDSLAAKTLTRMSYSADYLGFYDLCQEYNFILLDLYKKSNNLSGQASAFNDIGIVHYYKEEFNDALKYSFKALKIYQELNDSSGLAMVYNNIANCQADSDSFVVGLNYYLLALNINEKLNDIEGIALCLGNIGETHFVMGHLEKAYQYYRKSIKIAHQEKIDDWYLITPYLGIVSYFTNTQQLDSALLYAKEVLKITKINDMKAEIAQSYRALSTIYEKLDAYDKSLSYYKKYKLLEDSIYKDRSNSRISELNAMYELNEKDNQIAFQKMELEKEAQVINRNKIIMIVLLVAVCLISMIVYFLFRSNQKRKLVNKLLNEKNDLIEDKNHHITQSILYARKIQNAILPSLSNVRESFPNIFIFYKPKDIVSGDFYWHAKDKEISTIAAVDCTGHGVPGAFMSMMANDLLNQIILDEHIQHPSDVLTLLDKRVKQNLKKDDEYAESRDGLDIAMITYHHEQKQLEYSGAKNDLYLIRNGNLMIYKASRFSIGGSINEKEFSGESIDIQSGDEVFLFTDGYADQFGGDKNKKFSYKRFRKLLSSLEGMNVENKKQEIQRNLEEWKGKEEQLDDICIIGIKF